MEVDSKIIFSDKPSWWYVELMDNIPIGIYRTTFEGKIIFCNRTFAKIFGFDSRKELTDYSAINLYRDIKERGAFLNALLSRGFVEGLPLPLKRRDDTPIWCADTAKAIFDEDGIVVFIDGILWDITAETEEKEAKSYFSDAINDTNSFSIILSPNGKIMDIDENGCRLFGYPKNKFINRSLLDFISPQFKNFFSHFIDNIVTNSREEGFLTIVDSKGEEHHIQIHAFVIKKEGKLDYIKAIARDATKRIIQQRAELSREKFQGVLEMAGGVAHRLNQPLTIINNLLNEVLSALGPGDPNYQKIVKVHNQIKKVNEIAKKVSGIKKYKSMDYVDGVKIVDIDKAS